MQTPARVAAVRVRPLTAMGLGCIVSLLTACGTVPDVPPGTAPVAHASPDDVSRADAPTADVSVADTSTADISAPYAGAPDAGAFDVATTADTPVDASPTDSATLPCGPGFTCPSGYRCVGLSTTRCVQTADLGAPCRNGPVDPLYCSLDATCESVRGVDRCVAYGVERGVCRNTDGCAPRCDPGLGCDVTTHCRPGLALGELCGGVEYLCNEGSACMDVSGTRRCVADGATGGYCRVGRLCDARLLCQGSNSGSATGCNREYFRCMTGLQAGEPCEPTGAPCGAGTTRRDARGAVPRRGAPVRREALVPDLLALPPELPVHGAGRRPLRPRRDPHPLPCPDVLRARDGRLRGRGDRDLHRADRGDRAVSGHGNGPGVGQFLMATVGQFPMAIDRSIPFPD